jgi:plasmid maintenance system antidote protein VapI
VVTVPRVSARLDVQRLLDAAKARSQAELARQLDVAPANLCAYVRDGITVQMADRWAARLGLHPAEVWGSDFYVGTEVNA